MTLQEDFWFQYEGNRTQIIGLADVSNIVRQDITVNCHNTVVYYDAATADYNNAVHLMSYGEKVLTAGGKRKRKGGLKYNVDEGADECQVCTVFKENAHT